MYRDKKKSIPIYSSSNTTTTKNQPTMTQSQSPPLHIYFFPLMAAGHLIPLVDMARKFARHDAVNVKVTIFLTHLNAPQFRSTIERDRQQGSDIHIREVTFPTAEVGLPANCGTLASITSPHMYSLFDDAIQLLSVPAEQFLKEDRPDCIVSDFFIPWTAGLASKLRIPRIVFQVTGCFSLCVHHSVINHKPHKGLELGPDLDTPFVVPGLPDVVTMTRRRMPNFLRENSSVQILENAKEAASASYGVVFNSFKELGSDYVEYYKSNICSKAWLLGPVSLCNENTIDKARRGGGDDDKRKAMTEAHCLDWLSTKEPNSVVYVCYGTLSVFSAPQTREIAAGLESCGRDFIWVVKGEEGTLPEGFEERVGKRGLLIKSWAPQVLILEHECVGGFLTHCGWNSLLEGVSAGKPMITWPISAEHFENERMLTEVLKIGVSVGNNEWTEMLDVPSGLVKGESIAKAVNEVLGGGESVEMRNRAMALSDKAKKAVAKGGSSYNDLHSLLEEVRMIRDGEIVV